LFFCTSQFLYGNTLEVSKRLIDLTTSSFQMVE